MPDKAEPNERAELAAIVAVGKEIVRLRHIAPRFVPGAMVDAALAPLAEGRSGEAIARLDDIDTPGRRPAPRKIADPSEPQGRHPGDFGPALPIFASYFDRPLQ